MLQKYSRPKEAQRTVAAVMHTNPKAEVSAFDSGRSRAEILALESHWSFLERRCASSPGFAEVCSVVK